MRSTFLVATAVACLAGSVAYAQDTTTQDTTTTTTTTTTSTSSNGASLRGFRAEIQAGGDRFQSQGRHDGNFAFGGAIGFDGQIGDRFVIGPEFTYWRGRGKNTSVGRNGGIVEHRSRYEIGAGARAGYLFNPQLLGYVSGGWVSDKQRKFFTGTPTEAGYFNRINTDGFQIGAGVEYQLTDRFYTGLGYRYSNYEDHTSRQRLFLSAGVRF